MYKRASKMSAYLKAWIEVTVVQRRITAQECCWRFPLELPLESRESNASLKYWPMDTLITLVKLLQNSP